MNIDFFKTAILSTLLISACGPIAPLGNNDFYIQDTTTLSVSSTFDGKLYGRCKTEQSIQPEYDDALDGSGYFSVCPAPDHSAGVVVFGEPLDPNKKICVFPTEVASNSRVYPKLDSNGFPMLSCGENQPAGQKFVFENTSFNALFIVPYADRNAMQLCLASGNYFDCPRSFSYGKFR